MPAHCEKPLTESHRLMRHDRGWCISPNYQGCGQGGIIDGFIDLPGLRKCGLRSGTGLPKVWPSTSFRGSYRSSATVCSAVRAEKNDAPNHVGSCARPFSGRWLVLSEFLSSIPITRSADGR